MGVLMRHDDLDHIHISSRPFCTPADFGRRDKVEPADAAMGITLEMIYHIEDTVRRYGEGLTETPHANCETPFEIATQIVRVVAVALREDGLSMGEVKVDKEVCDAVAAIVTAYTDVLNENYENDRYEEPEVLDGLAALLRVVDCLPPHLVEGIPKELLPYAMRPQQP
ncbi:hypothetical protein CUR85_13400 [Sulfitobacter faviae]|nr:hypothetical protein [Sulfitobacter faviae]